MSLNDGITQKQRGRAELEALVAAFQQSGGTVTRSREHRATGGVQPDAHARIRAGVGESECVEPKRSGRGRAAWP